MKRRYIGNFPPPYGGVTRKNELLFQSISEQCEITRLRIPKWLPKQLFDGLQLLQALLPGQQLVIGLSAAGGKSRLLTWLLYHFNRRTMRRSIYFMMGGTEADRIASSQCEVKWYRNYRAVYAEMPSMVETLRLAGAENAKWYPNARVKVQLPMRLREDGKRFSCVFFSWIHPDKGIDLIMEAAAELPEIDFVFYGPIFADLEERFRHDMQCIPNVEYKGVFQGTTAETCAELSNYDVLLLPSRYWNEGVPGILVEAKIAGLTSIVSANGYNSEIVSHGETGLVVSPLTCESLISAIRTLYEDRELLNRLSAASRQSAADYQIEHYLPEIIADLHVGDVME